MAKASPARWRSPASAAWAARVVIEESISATRCRASRTSVMALPMSQATSARTCSISARAPARPCCAPARRPSGTPNSGTVASTSPVAAERLAVTKFTPSKLMPESLLRVVPLPSALIDGR